MKSRRQNKMAVFNSSLFLRQRVVVINIFVLLLTTCHWILPCTGSDIEGTLSLQGEYTNSGAGPSIAATTHGTLNDVSSGDPSFSSGDVISQSSDLGWTSEREPKASGFTLHDLVTDSIKGADEASTDGISERVKGYHNASDRMRDFMTTIVEVSSGDLLRTILADEGLLTAVGKTSDTEDPTDEPSESLFSSATPETIASLQDHLTTFAHTTESSRSNDTKGEVSAYTDDKSAQNAALVISKATTFDDAEANMRAIEEEGAGASRLQEETTDSSSRDLPVFTTAASTALPVSLDLKNTSTAHLFSKTMRTSKKHDKGRKTNPTRSVNFTVKIFSYTTKSGFFSVASTALPVSSDLENTSTALPFSRTKETSRKPANGLETHPTRSINFTVESFSHTTKPEGFSAEVLTVADKSATEDYQLTSIYSGEKKTSPSTTPVPTTAEGLGYVYEENKSHSISKQNSSTQTTPAPVEYTTTNFPTSEMPKYLNKDTYTQMISSNKTETTSNSFKATGEIAPRNEKGQILISGFTLEVNQTTDVSRTTLIPTKTVSQSITNEDSNKTTSVPSNNNSDHSLSIPHRKKTASQDITDSEDKTEIMTTFSGNQTHLSPDTDHGLTSEYRVTTSDNVYTRPAWSSYRTRASSASVYAEKTLTADKFSTSYDSFSRTRRESDLLMQTTAEVMSTTPSARHALPATEFVPSLTTRQPTTTPTPTTTTAEPLLGVGCTQDETCSVQIPNSLCLASVCGCPDNFHNHSGGKKCLREPYNVTARVFGTDCLNITWAGDSPFNVSIQDDLRETNLIADKYETCDLKPGENYSIRITLSEGGRNATTSIIILLVMGDFNACTLSGELPSLQQYVTCHTRGTKTLDLCYGSIPHAFSCQSLPPVGRSDHSSVHLIPKYRQRLKRVKPRYVMSRPWAENSLETLRGCFDCTEWSSLYDPLADINTNLDVITEYIKFCQDCVIPPKKKKLFPNTKPWFTAHIYHLLKQKRKAFAAKSMLQVTELTREVRSEIRKAKLQFKEKVEEEFSRMNARAAFQHLRTMMEVGDSSRSNQLPAATDPMTFATDLNNFYNRFDTADFSVECSRLMTAASVVEGSVTINVDEVRSQFRKTKATKAAGPDGISARLLSSCADSLAPAFQPLFQASVDSGTVPTLWKTSVIIPVPKKPRPSEPNHYRPVALTRTGVQTCSHDVCSSSFVWSVNTTTVPSAPQNGFARPCPDNPSTCLTVGWTAGSGLWDIFSLTTTSLNWDTRSIKTESNYTRLDKLPPATQFTFNVTALSSEVSSKGHTFQGCTAPETIKITDSSTTEDTFTVTWQSPAEAVDRIELRWRPRSHDNNITVRLNAWQLFYTVSNLNPGTTYLYSLVAEFCGIENSSDVRSLVTKVGDIKNASVVPRGSQLDIWWELTNMSASDVSVRLSITDDRGEVYSNTTSSSRFQYDTGLYGSCFKVVLTPVYNNHRGQPYTLHVTTQEKEPGAVQNLQAQRSQHSVKVTWARPEVTHGVVVQYVVGAEGLRGLRSISRTLNCSDGCHLQCGTTTVRRQERSAREDAFPGSTSNFSVTLTGLSEYENYKITVTAATRAGAGPENETIVGGQLLDRVANLSAAPLNATCLSVTWSQPPNVDVYTPITGIAIEYRQTGSDARGGNATDVTVTDDANTLNVRGDLQAQELCGLEFWTEYEVNVTAVSEGRRQGNTASVKGRTSEHVPGPVINLTLSPVAKKPRILYLQWEKPFRQNGNLVKFFVVVRGNNTFKELSVISATCKDICNTSLQLTGGESYIVEVFGATGAGNGTVTQKTVILPDAVIPKTVAVVTSSGTSLASSTTLSLPKSLLCEQSYGRVVTRGYIVYPGHLDIARKIENRSQAESLRAYKDPASVVFVNISHLPIDCQAINTPLYVVVGPPARLQSGGHYGAVAVACTRAGCTYTAPSPVFATLVETQRDDGSSSLAAGLVPVLLLCLVGVGFGFYMYRRKQQRRKAAMKTVQPQEATVQMEEICTSKPVPMAKFMEHVEMLHRDSNLGFSDEYKYIKDVSPDYSKKAAEIPACKAKNRYTNILPFDRSRVKLLPTDDDEGSDYINASYLPGEKHQREFIAAQGPLPGTIDDFWRMVWENRVSVIVMLTQCVERGKTKCEQYWPEEGEQEIYGDLVVQLRSQSVLPDYIIRVIDISLGNQSRMIKHFHFMRWPDHGCPERTSMLLNFVSSVRAHMPHSGSGPMLVHCSAGVGRTGTFVALDQLLQQIRRQPPTLDIFALVLAMRHHRTQMVQTECQYIYIHDCLVDALTKDKESDDDQSQEEEDEHVYNNC